MQEQTQPQAEASEPTQAEQSQAESPEQAPASNSSAQTVKQAQSKLQMPVAGEIIRAFSGEHLVYNKTLNAWSTHNGIDIAAKEGEAVGAALAGEVTSAKMDSTLAGSSPFRIRMTAAQSMPAFPTSRVKEGDKVNAGQQLGTAGIPPFESDLGVHVHFKISGKRQICRPRQNRWPPNELAPFLPSFLIKKRRCTGAMQCRFFLLPR